MLAYTVRRLVLIVPTLLVVSLLLASCRAFPAEEREEKIVTGKVLVDG